MPKISGMPKCCFFRCGTVISNLQTGHRSADLFLTEAWNVGVSLWLAKSCAFINWSVIHTWTQRSRRNKFRNVLEKGGKLIMHNYSVTWLILLISLDISVMSLLTLFNYWKIRVHWCQKAHNDYIILEMTWLHAWWENTTQLKGKYPIMQ